MKKIEYRVREVKRYIVTRWETEVRGEGKLSTCGEGGSTMIGREYDTFKEAHNVAYAVCAQEHKQLGWPEDDARIIYPNEELPKVPELPRSYGLS